MFKLKVKILHPALTFPSFYRDVARVMGVLFISLTERERLYVCIMVRLRLNSPGDQLKLSVSVSKYTPRRGDLRRLKDFKLLSACSRSVCEDVLPDMTALILSQMTFIVSARQPQPLSSPCQPRQRREGMCLLPHSQGFLTV